MKNRLLVLFSLSVWLWGCMSVKVQPVSAENYTIKQVCIERNEAVIVDDFLSVLQAGLTRHDIDSHVVEPGTSSPCEYLMTYIAKQSWDFVTYLSYAKLELFNYGQSIGIATYQHNGGSMSLAPTKWMGTASKMDPVIDELFEGF